MVGNPARSRTTPPRQPLERAAATAIEAAERWTKREPQRAEAWFYLAGAYAPLVQWRILRGQRLAAARDGDRIKSALERALDARSVAAGRLFRHRPLSLLRGVAPAAVKMLRWLLFLPGGDREQGLREMQRARDGGALLRGEADYQLHWLYLWYEQQPARALELLRGSMRATVESAVPRAHRRSRSATTFTITPPAPTAWQTLLDRANAKQVAAAEMTAVRARIGLAQELSGDVRRASRDRSRPIDGRCASNGAVRR